MANEAALISVEGLDDVAVTPDNTDKLASLLAVTLIVIITCGPAPLAVLVAVTPKA